MASLGLVVVGTFGLVWAPWLGSWGAARQVLTRLVPLSRGIFEDYVANFWCVSNVIFKWKLRLSQQVGRFNRALSMGRFFNLIQSNSGLVESLPYIARGNQRSLSALQQHLLKADCPSVITKSPTSRHGMLWNHCPPVSQCYTTCRFLRSNMAPALGCHRLQSPEALQHPPFGVLDAWLLAEGLDMLRPDCTVASSHQDGGPASIEARPLVWRLSAGRQLRQLSCMATWPAQYLPWLGKREHR